MVSIPRRDGKRNEPLILKVDAAGYVVNSRLGCTIVSQGEGDMLHGADAAGDASDDDELGLFGVLQQGDDSLEEVEGAEGVHVEHLLHVVDVQRRNGAEAARDSSVGDDKIELGDIVLRLDALDGCSRVGRGRALDLDEDELAAFGLGELRKGLGGFGRGVADAADNDVVCAGEVTFQKSMTNTWGKESKDEVSYRDCLDVVLMKAFFDKLTSVNASYQDVGCRSHACRELRAEIA
jgi:hypothetical protein